MQLIEKDEVLPGMPFEIYKNNLKELKEKFNKEISEKIKTKTNGIIAKADSLGSLEALLFLLENQKIPVVKSRNREYKQNRCNICKSKYRNK